MMRAFERVVDGVWRLSVWPFDALNAYVLGDVLVDSGTPQSAARLLRALEGRPLAGHALTHAHFDHQGGSHEVCETLELPLWCGDGDRAAMESGHLTQLLPNPESPLACRVGPRLAGPSHPVARTLQEGNRIGDFTVVEAPGHTPGHLAYWREEDGVLVLGDVLFHRNPLTLRKRLQEPFRLATFDPATNRNSARKLAALRPTVVCFGHGPPLRAGRVFLDFVEALA